MLYSGGVKRPQNTVLQPTDDLFSQLNLVKANATISTAQFQADQAGYRDQVAGFTNAANALQTSSQVFTNKDSILERKYVTDSSSAITGSATNAAEPAVYDFSVQQLASAQRNEGASVAASGFGAIAAGRYSVGITAGNGQEKQLTVNILSTDNNKQALTKLANAINYTASGVKAEVKMQQDKCYLSVEGKNTGAASGFTLRDISNNLVSTLNLSNKVQTSKDAVYTVNGETKQAASNQIKIDSDKVSLTLKSTGTDKVTIAGDSTKTVNAVRELVANYNEINYNLQNADNLTKRGEKLLDTIQSQFTGFRRGQYQNIGITLDGQTGDINVDTNRLNKALRDNPTAVERLLAGSTGLAAATEKTAHKALSVPASGYFKAPSISNYLNYGSSIFGVGTSQNLYNYSQGLFFDLLV